MYEEVTTEDVEKLIEDAESRGVDLKELIRRLLITSEVSQWYFRRQSGDGSGHIKNVKTHGLGLSIETWDGASLEYCENQNGQRWRLGSSLISRIDAERFLGVWPGYLDAIEDLFWEFWRLKDDVRTSHEELEENLKRKYTELYEDLRLWLSLARHPELKRWRELNPTPIYKIPPSLRHIRNLKQIEVSEPCYVYFLLNSGEVVYVGQTSSAWPKRILQHIKDQEKIFDDVWCLEVDRQSLTAVEGRFIKEFRPKYNRTGNPGALAMNLAGSIESE